MKNRKNLHLLLLFISVSSILICLFLFMNSWVKEPKQMERDQLGEKGNLPGMTMEEIQAEMNRKVEEGSLSISINNELIFNSGDANGYLRIENSQHNHYLMVVEIFRKDTNERIYKSGALEPGYYLEQDKLDVNLSKGDYQVLIKFKAYDLKSENFIGEAHAESTIKILH